MTLKELENVMNLIKKYDDVFLLFINTVKFTDTVKTMSKMMKRQMKEKTLMKIS